MKGAAMDLWEPMGAWATSRPGLAFQPRGGGNCTDRGFHASLFLEA
ncbi:unnamed protein product [Brassica oleracea]